MFRSVKLPNDVPGTLLLHSMPGRQEPFQAAQTAIEDAGVGRVVCLNPTSEIEYISPEYASAIRRGLAWRHVHLPMPDFGVPDDERAFRATAQSVADALRNGESVLIHCAAGIGRTGTFAVAVLTELDVELSDARQLVREAGSRAESKEQVEFLRRYQRGS